MAEGMVGTGNAIISDNSVDGGVGFVGVRGTDISCDWVCPRVDVTGGAVPRRGGVGSASVITGDTPARCCDGAEIDARRSSDREGVEECCPDGLAIGCVTDGVDEFDDATDVTEMCCASAGFGVVRCGPLADFFADPERGAEISTDALPDAVPGSPESSIK